MTGMEIFALSLSGLEEQSELFLSYLPNQERREIDRVLVDAERLRKAAGRAVVRHTLAERTGKSHVEITIERGKHGKPYFVEGCVQFNVAHSGRWIYFAVDTDPIGIDVEEIREKMDFTGVMDMMFTAAEREWVLMESPIEKRFFQVWTAKEAILKQHGTGLIGQNPRDVCTRRSPDWIELPSPEGYCVSVAGKQPGIRWNGLVQNLVPKINKEKLEGFTLAPLTSR